MESKYEQILSITSKLNMTIVSQYLPKQIIEDYKKERPGKYRERLYGLQIVLQGMLYQALHEDKSEHNAVLYIKETYSKLQEEVIIQEEKFRKSQQRNQKRKRGRPRKKLINIQKSKMQDISLNTASYDEARQRFPLDLSIEIFNSLRPNLKDEKLWHGHRVYICDGTTAKTPDTTELRKYLHPKKDPSPHTLPIIRIEGIIDLYGGYVVDLDLDIYNSSEGRMLRRLSNKIPKGTILLADDLYSGFGHFAYCGQRGIKLVSQGKHKRKDKVVKELGNNDDLVEWESKYRPPWYTDEDVLPKKLIVRRISCSSPERPGRMMYIYTLLLDPDKYPVADILALYCCRWDIELGFREIKTILNLEYLRSKTVDMIKKEIYAHLILYNIIRIIMIEAFDYKGADFFSLGKRVHSNVTIPKTKDSYVDRLGRSYARRSPGRYAGIPI